MKKFICLAGCLLLTTVILTAQDEGVIKKRERIDRNKSIFIGGGGSFTLGKNIGDYSVGFNGEVGFLKRLNRILSIGPSISYLNFKYDPEITSASRGAYYGTGDIPIEYNSAYDTWNDKYGLNQEYDYAYVLTLEGGDLSLISLALNIKVNFIPITDNTKFSIYGFAKPFIALTNRKAVTGSGKRWVWEAYEDTNGTSNEADDYLYPNTNDDKWYPDGYEEAWSSEGTGGFPVLAKESSVTGGIFLGPGIEIMPAKSVSIFLQAAFGYTFPVSYVSTKSYDDTVQSYASDEFPMVKKGFPSINLQCGVSFNF